MITKVTQDNYELYRKLFDKAEVYLNGQEAFDNYNPETSEGYVAIRSIDEYFAVLEDLTAGENLNKNHVFKFLPLDEPVFNIDVNSRDIIVPEVFRKNGVGVQGDQLAETLYFAIDRYFETIDLFRDDIIGIVQWESAAKGKQYETGWSRIEFKDVTIIKDKMVFAWFLNDVITSNPGTVKFSIRFFSTTEERDDSNNKILKLDFSLSTKTQTITINPAISYEINDENGLPEVNGYNDLNLVVSRFKDSVYVGEADHAEAPVFDREHGGIFNSASQCIDHVEITNEDGSTETVHIVDLNAEGKLVLSTEAHSIDAGKISYYWYGKELADDAIPSQKNSGPVYIPTTDRFVNGEKTYYVKTNANGVDAYIEATGLPLDESMPTDTTYYEVFNGIEVNSTGEYWVIAKNRHGVASAEAKSGIVKVPGPAELTVVAPLKDEKFLNAEGYLALNVVGTTTQVNDHIRYEWVNLTTEEPLKSEDLTNNGFNADGSSKNHGSDWNNEGNTVPVADLPYYDETLEVTVWASRNGDDTAAQKFEIRVTADPQPLDVAPINTLPSASLTNDVEIGVTVSRKINGDDRDIVSDEILYQWFKYTSDEEDDDLLIEGADEATYVVPGGENAASGIFYCRVGNKVKGQVAYKNSDRINVIRA